MRLRQIEMLQAIVSTGSVTAAAKLLNVSQPAVSKMLAHTEQQLGFPLFVRDGGRLRPTDEAFALYAEVERLMPRLEAVNRLAENLRRGRGRLRIVAVPSLAQTLLPQALARFCAERPQLEVELQTLHTRELVDALLLRDADVGFDFGGLDHPSIRRTAVARTGLVGVVPIALDLPAGVLTPAVARTTSLIRMAGSDPLSGLVSQAARGEWQRGGIRFIAQSNHSAMALVAAGLGVALVDPFTAADADRHRVNLVPLEPPVPIRVEACVATNRPVSAQAEALARAVAVCARSTT